MRKITDETANPNVAAIKVEVSSRIDVRMLFDSIASRFGSCEVFVNMAGINKDGPFFDMDDEQ